MCKSVDEDLGPWLALYFLRELTLPQKHQLLAHWPEPAQMLAASRRQFEEAGLSPAAIKAVSDCLKMLKGGDEPSITRTLQWQQNPNHHIVSLGDPRYPAALRALATPPLLLFVAGDAKLLAEPQIAIVGSRNATPAGLETAKEMAIGLSKAGLVVTSGMALGIDTASHQGALAASGPTIAVLGCGIDIPYPRRNTALAQQITESGALVSEFPLSCAPRRENFPQRNRVISGLSQGVLVVEAALKSGSLISANYAAQQGREVFAVPGSIYNPQSRGCHQLIREGAKLAETINDVLEELSCQYDAPTLSVEQSDLGIAKMSDVEGRILAQVDFNVTSLDVLASRCGLAINILCQNLVSLELKGQVSSVAGGYTRAPGSSALPQKT